MQTRLAAVALALFLGLPRSMAAQAQGAQTASPASTGQTDVTGACTITSRGNQQKTCMNRVPQASCAANAREQRTTFDWKAGADCP